ncbi:MAG: TolC family protein [Bacteroidales bacterium]|nr:TolC family protein [Bacteroidales bacterium]
MRIHKTILLMTLLAPACIPATAQKAYNLRMLIDRVLGENYRIGMVRIGEEMAAENNTPGNAGMLPTLSVSGSSSRSLYDMKQQLSSGDVREAGNAKNTALSGQISLDWKLFDGFRMFAMKEQLGLLEQIGRVNTRFYIEQTVTDVAMLYEQIIAGRMLLRNEQKALGVSAFRLRIENRKLEIGAGDALQYNQALVDYHDDSLAVLDRMRIIRSLEVQTNRILCTDPSSPVVPADTVMPPGFLPPLDTLTAMAYRANSEIEQSALEEMVAETHIRVAQAGYYPTLDLSGQYNYNHTTSKIGYAVENRSYGPWMGVTVRLNLFDGLNVRRDVNNARLGQQTSALLSSDVRNTIRSSVTDQYYQWESLQQQLMLARDNRQAALTSMEIAELQFRKGLIDGYNFRLTQLSVLHATNQVIQIELAMRLLEISLHRQAGSLLAVYY